MTCCENGFSSPDISEVISSALFNVVVVEEPVIVVLPEPPLDVLELDEEKLAVLLPESSTTLEPSPHHQQHNLIEVRV